MSHTRTVCQHDVVITQCRCIEPHKATEVVRPCPFGDQHLGYFVVHPEPTRPNLTCPRCGGPLRTDTFTNTAGSSVRQLCIARGCGWSVVTGAASEGAQLTAVDLWGPSGSPGNPLPPTEGAQGHTAGQEEPVEAALTIQIHGRKSGRIRPTWDILDALRARTGANLDPFSEDLALYGVAMIDAHGNRIEPRRGVIRP